jgi:hypothetical protein
MSFARPAGWESEIDPATGLAISRVDASEIAAGGGAEFARPLLPYEVPAVTAVGDEALLMRSARPWPPVSRGASKRHEADRGCARTSSRPN